MGELRTRKRGKTWEWSFEGAKIDGKRKPISKGGYRTKAEAQAAGTQAKAEYDNAGRVFTPADISVADYMTYWYNNYVVKNLQYNSQINYKRIIDTHIVPHLGIYKLSSISPDIIQKWIDDKRMAGFSKDMLKQMLSRLRTAMDYAIIPCEFIKTNPAQYVRIGKVPTNKDRKAHTEYICSKKDFAEIIERFDPSTNFYLPLMTGYHCGTRIGETYGFDLLTDVDFENHTITINHQLTKEHGKWFYRPPKYESYRTIKIDAFYENLLKQEIHKRKKDRLRYGQYFTVTYLMPDSSIFQAPADIIVPKGKEIMPISTQENGELLTPESFKYCARVIHHELGNTLFHSHSLRHAHGTLLAENGAQPKTVMERLGHKDIKTTLERYVFNTEKMQTDAVDIFTRAIS